MMAFKVIRKIGKMLRGGAGQKEIFLGALCGVLIGFNPVAGLTLALAILLALLLNANLGFTLLGVLAGKLAGLALAVISFHTGFFIIHNMGLEGLFTKLINAPVTALMDLDVYALVGSLPFALLIGIAFGKFMQTTVTKIREQMVRAGEHDKVGKVASNKFARFLMWLVFGKQKVSTADVLTKESPLLRKSGLILVGGAIVLGLVFEFFLLDLVVKSGLQSAISARTGAEVNVTKAHLSLATGKLEIEQLQITDPDQPTHNKIEIEHLVADLSVSDLLRRTYTIDLLAGTTLKRNVLRQKPGAIYTKPTPPKKEEKESTEKEKQGKSLDTYFAQAQKWEKVGGKIQEFLKKRKENAAAITQGKKPKSTKAAAVVDAKKLGYLKAAADLVSDRPAWTIHRIEIAQIQPALDLPPQTFLGLELSSHPELLEKPTTLQFTPMDGGDPTFKVVLHFEDSNAAHELALNVSGLPIGGLLKTSADFPVDVTGGQVDLKTTGTFSADTITLPFSLLVHDLKANVESGQKVLGMDSATATEVFSSMEQLNIDGAIGGNLRSPRVKVDTEKLTASIKTALVSAGKKELSNRANKEINKLLDSQEGSDTTEKAKGLLKKFF